SQLGTTKVAAKKTAKAAVTTGHWRTLRMTITSASQGGTFPRGNCRTAPSRKAKGMPASLLSELPVKAIACSRRAALVDPLRLISGEAARNGARVCSRLGFAESSGGSLESRFEADRSPRRLELPTSEDGRKPARSPKKAHVVRRLARHAEPHVPPRAGRASS